MNAKNIELFRQEMNKFGLKYSGEIIADGKLHRFKAEGDKGKNSWYVLHDGACPAGAFGCWKRDLKETWCAKRQTDFTTEDWEQIKNCWRQVEEKRQQMEAKLRAKARQVAEWITKRAKQVTDHPYLTKKGVKKFGDLCGYYGALVLPLRNVGGDLLTLQFISSAGDKKFLTGGQATGVFLILPGGEDGPLFICEGYATAASVREATGFTTICAMNCHNLLTVAKALRAKSPEREIVIAGDNDHWTEGNPGIKNATEAANAVRAKIVVPKFEDLETKPTDFNDLQRLAGLEEVKRQLATAQFPVESESEMLARLAALSPLEFDRCYKDEAERLGVTATVLKKEVLMRRPAKSQKQNEAGGLPTEPKLEPWPDPVDGAQLLCELRKEFRRFLILSSDADVVLALWTLHTYCFQQFLFTPYLNITSPEKRCGKSTLLDLIGALCHAPLFSANMSGPVMFRLVEDRHPTLLLDEWDSLDDEATLAARSILNSGFKANGKTHRCVGDDHEVREFSTFSPKVICGIGKLTDTTGDRCIVIPMVRKLPGEKVARFRKYDGTNLKRRCLRWAADNLEKLTRAATALPDELGDRAQDIWEPLLAIADCAGGEWPALARTAAVTFSGPGNEAEGIRTLLLTDIRAVFVAAKVNRLPSDEICQTLAKLEGRPWSEFGRRQKDITPNLLAVQLRRFNVVPQNIKFAADKVLKGYYLDDFEEVFARYLPTDANSNRYPATEPDNKGVGTDTEALPAAVSSESKPTQVIVREAGSGVADQKPGKVADEQNVLLL